MSCGFYDIYVGNYDWGAAVDKAIISLDACIPDFVPERLKVSERKMAGKKDSVEHELYEITSERRVTDAYYCDESGCKAEGPTRFLAVELYVSPVEGTPFACTGLTQIFIWSDPYELTFVYDGQALELEPKWRNRYTAADAFAKKSYKTSSGILYDYAEYVPEQKTDTLFVWLHGLGEGHYEGSDVYLPLMGRKGTTMAGEKFQKTVGGAVILVPQCPTYWMDADGKQTNFLVRHEKIDDDGTSFYTDSLDEFIDTYAAAMDAKHIVIAGCSNGGYMCMLLAMKSPDKYDAVVPICEAVIDAAISDASIERLRRAPLYFVYAKNDPIVIPETHEIPTIRRLREGDCLDLHVFEAEKVIDTSGVYKDEEGNPYEYMGHLSWIYYDNDETDDGTGLSAWNWIAQRIAQK